MVRHSRNTRNSGKLHLQCRHSNAATSLAECSLSSHYVGPTNELEEEGRRGVVVGCFCIQTHVWHLFICAALEHLVPILYFITGLFGNLVVFLSKRWKCLNDSFFLPLQQRVNRRNCLPSTQRFVLTERRINKGKRINSDSRHGEILRPEFHPEIFQLFALSRCDWTQLIRQSSEIITNSQSN